MATKKKPATAGENSWASLQKLAGTGSLVSGGQFVTPPEGLDRKAVEVLIAEYNGGERHAKHSAAWKFNRAIANARQDNEAAKARLKRASAKGIVEFVKQYPTAGAIAMAVECSTTLARAAMERAEQLDPSISVTIRGRRGLNKGEDAYGPQATADRSGGSRSEMLADFD